MQYQKVMCGAIAGMLMATMLIMFAVPTGAEQTGPDTPYEGGNWAVDDGVNVIENETIQITGNWIVSDFSSLTLKNCNLIVNLSAPGDWRTVNVDATSSLNLQDCTITDNQDNVLDGNEGGIYFNYAGETTWDNVTIEETWVEVVSWVSGSEFYGNDITYTWTSPDPEAVNYNYLDFLIGQWDTIELTDSTFDGIYNFIYVNSGESVTVTDCTLVAETTQPDNLAIGTIYYQYLNVSGCAISNVNIGVLAMYVDEVNIDNCTITGDDYGGTLSDWNGAITAYVADYYETSFELNVADVDVADMDEFIQVASPTETAMSSVVINIQDCSADNLTYAFALVDMPFSSATSVEMNFFNTDFTDNDQIIFFYTEAGGPAYLDTFYYDCIDVTEGKMNTSMLIDLGYPFYFTYKIFNTVTLQPTNNDFPVNMGSWIALSQDEEGGWMQGAFPEQTSFYALYSYNITGYDTYFVNYSVYFDYNGNFAQIDDIVAEEPMSIEIPFDTPQLFTNLGSEIYYGDHTLEITSDQSIDNLVWDVSTEMPSLETRTGAFEGDESGYKQILNASYSIGVPQIDGEINLGEWVDADMARWYYYPTSDHPEGYIYVYAQMTEGGLYLLADVTADNTTEEMDYVAFGFNTNEDDYFNESDTMIMAMGDVGNVIAYSMPDFNPIFVAKGFNSTPNNATEHVFWEVFVPWDLLDLEMNQSVDFFGMGYGTLAPAWSYPNWQFSDATDVWEFLIDQEDDSINHSATLKIKEPIDMGNEIDISVNETQTLYIRIRASNENGTTYVVKTINVIPYTPVLNYTEDTNITVEADDEGVMTFSITFTVDDQTDEMFINVTEDSEFYGWGFNLTVLDEAGDIIYQGDFYNEVSVPLNGSGDYEFVFTAIPPPGFDATEGQLVNGTIGFTPVAPDGTMGDTVYFAISLSPLAGGLADLWLWLGIAIISIVLVVLVIYAIRRRRASPYGGQGQPLMEREMERWDMPQDGGDEFGPGPY